jgi:hypothetical protein
MFLTHTGLYLWLFEDIGAILSAILFFWQCYINAFSFIAFLDPEIGNLDSTYMFLSHTGLYLQLFEDIGAILAAILFSHATAKNPACYHRFSFSAGSI